jgi:hypothetical protein
MIKRELRGGPGCDEENVWLKKQEKKKESKKSCRERLLISHV